MLNFNHNKLTNSGVYIYKYRLCDNLNQNKETNSGVYIYKCRLYNWTHVCFSQWGELLQYPDRSILQGTRHEMSSVVIPCHR